MNKNRTFQQRKQVENSLSYTFKMMTHNALTSLQPLPEISKDPGLACECLHGAWCQ